MQTKAPSPFFILGCVRSGTTMLRNILRLHPHLACPEETHFYRWHEPFGSPGYRQIAISNQTLKRHREIDGITEAEFAEMLGASTSRADLSRRYMALYIERRKPGATRWFDKTPQNAYGASMVAMEFPQARFLHIVRDPVNVVASLRIGKVMKMADLVGACNYWNEAVANMAVLKKAFPGRVLEISYEAFTNDSGTGIREVLDFLEEPCEPAWFSSVVTSEVRHDDGEVLSPAEMDTVRRLCASGRVRHGYAADLRTERAERVAERQRLREERAARRQAVKGD